MGERETVVYAFLFNTS